MPPRRGGHPPQASQVLWSRLFRLANCPCCGARVLLPSAAPGSPGCAQRIRRRSCLGRALGGNSPQGTFGNGFVRPIGHPNWWTVPSASCRAVGFPDRFQAGDPTHGSTSTDALHRSPALAALPWLPTVRWSSRATWANSSSSSWPCSGRTSSCRGGVAGSEQPGAQCPGGPPRSRRGRPG